MVLTQTHGIVSVLLNHTRTRGPSVADMRDFCMLFSDAIIHCIFFCRSIFFVVIITAVPLITMFQDSSQLLSSFNEVRFFGRH